jgi:ketosteroid isomerase-like protein
MDLGGRWRDTAHAMSQENVELIRVTVEAFNRNDLDAVAETMHPEVVWETLDVLPDMGTFRGHEGVRSFWQMWNDTFRGFHLHLEACVPLDEDRVMATFRVTGEGAGSGARVESPTFFHVLEIHDGQIAHARMFTTKEEALEAAGLRE